MWSAERLEAATMRDGSVRAWQLPIILWRRLLWPTRRQSFDRALEKIRDFFVLGSVKQPQGFEQKRQRYRVIGNSVRHDFPFTRRTPSSGSIPTVLSLQKTRRRASGLKPCGSRGARRATE